MGKYLGTGGIEMTRRVVIISLTMIIILAAMPWLAVDTGASGVVTIGVSMDRFNTVSIGPTFSFAVKNDGSLWGCA